MCLWLLALSFLLLMCLLQISINPLCLQMLWYILKQNYHLSPCVIWWNWISLLKVAYSLFYILQLLGYTTPNTPNDKPFLISPHIVQPNSQTDTQQHQMDQHIPQKEHRDSFTHPLTPSTIGLSVWMQMVGGLIVKTWYQMAQRILERLWNHLRNCGWS